MPDFSGQGTVDLEAIRHFFDEGIPFNRFLGLHIEEIERGRVVAKLPIRAEFVGNPMRPALHGGVISTLADTVGGAALFTLTDPGDQLATIDLRVDYLRPGRKETLLGEGRVVRFGNRVGVSAITIWHPGARDEPVAAGMAAYNIKRGRPQ